MAEADTDDQQQLYDFVQGAILHQNSTEYAQLITIVQDLVVKVAPRTTPPHASPGPSKQVINQMTLILSAMSSTAASLHEETHEQLLRTLFQLHFWHTPMRILSAWADLLLHLLYARPAFHQACINHLVRNFYPPPPHLQQAARDAQDSAHEQPAPHHPSPAEEAAHECIIAALNHVVTQHPLLRDSIASAVSTCAPHRYQPRVALCAHFRAVFALAESPAGAALRDVLLFGAAEKLVEMDCDIRWEGIVVQLTGQEAEAGPSEDDGDEEDVFAVGAMEAQVEHLHLDGDRTRDGGAAAALDRLGADLQMGWEGHAAGSARREGGGAEALGAEASSSLTMAHKLDPLLLMLFQHMHTRAASAAAGGAPRLWRACMTIFERVLQLSQRVKFTPYIMFMGARLAGVENARAFAAALVTRACTPGEHKVCRTSCAAYAASFLARFAPLPLADVVACVQRLADFCSAYATTAGAPPRRRSPPKRASTDMGALRPATLARRATMPALTAHTPATMQRQPSAAAAPAVDALDWERHEVFYAGCQAAMYSLCYHMHALDEDTADKAAAAACADMRRLVSHSMVPLMASDLRPLDVCLPSVSREFVRQIARHGLGALPPPAAPPELMSRHGGRAAFEMFFPFDPYLLPVSAPPLALGATFRAWRGGHVVPDAAADAAAAGSDADEDDDTETRDGDRSSAEEGSQLESEDEEEVFGTSAPSDPGAARRGGAARDIAVKGRRKVYDVNPFAAASGAEPMSVEDRGHYGDMLHAFAAGSSPAANEWLGQSPDAPGGPQARGWQGEAMSLTEDAPWMAGARRGGHGSGGTAPMMAMRAGTAVGGGLRGRQPSP